ncbi:PAS domain-containing sensor histidine kinase [Roseospira navarrensis]|uniref:histidine kinase n=1 Tax=Roseospira navarrensis TaxID=140058 RepID=A0A7X2D414_9PROT|nr:PAS domain-containing sensor histidine kinase [Roseospira navarrensis]MQX36172.1 PAS domain-containing protein [Roseospira navarrensis]
MTDGDKRPRQPEAVPGGRGVSQWAVLMEGLGVPAFVKDRDLRFTDCNTLLATRVLGSTTADLLGRTAAQVMGPAAAAPHEEHDRALVRDADAGDHSPRVYDAPIRYAAAGGGAGGGARGHARFIKAALRDPATGAVTGVSGLIVDITADRARMAALERTAERSDHANAEKDRFLVNMSHQLRTPLNNVIGYAEALIMGVFGPLNETQRDYAESIVKAGRHMESVFGVVLDVARQTEPGHGDGETWVDLHTLCADMIQTALPSATAASVTLGLHEDEALAGRPLHVDEGALRHILHNLLANAIAFTGSGGRVDLTTALDRDRLLIRVSDSGGGATSGDRVRRILDPSSSAGGHRPDPQATAGVGLTIVKTLVAALGGVFDLHSVPGRGTTAAVRLPAARLGPARPSGP